METTAHSNVHAAGTTERDEWRTALSELSDRLESTERLQRLHTQSIVHIEDQARLIHGHAEEAVKLSDEAKAVGYTNLNARGSIANDKMFWGNPRAW